MKLTIRILLGSVIAFFIIIAIKNNRDWESLEYRISRFDEFVQNGEIISLADVFPFDWDYVQIVNAPGYYDLNREEIYAFAEKEDMTVSLVERFYLIVFRNERQIVGVIQYSPASNGPTFVEDGELKEQWILTTPKEKALFRCTKVRDYAGFNGYYDPTAEYSLEYVDEANE